MTGAKFAASALDTCWVAGSFGSFVTISFGNKLLKNTRLPARLRASSRPKPSLTGGVVLLCLTHRPMMTNLFRVSCIS